MAAQPRHVVGQLGGVGQRHSTFRGRDGLDRVEAENRNVGVRAGAHPAPLILAADRMGGILD